MEVIDIARLKSGEVNLGVSFVHDCLRTRVNDVLGTQTSIMAVQFKDGVVVGADSRTTTGSYIVCSLMLRSAATIPTIL